MQFEIKLGVPQARTLDFNYRYDLASALYRALDKSNPKLCQQLHDGECRSRLKLFCFSGLNSSPSPQVVGENGEKRLQWGSKVWMRFASIVPEIAYGFAEAIQRAGHLTVRGVDFEIKNISLVATPEFAPTTVYRPFGQSGMICCRFAREGLHFYQYPDNSAPEAPDCGELLLGNLRHKFLRLKEVRDDIYQNLVSLSNLAEAEIATVPLAVEFLPLMAERAFRTGLFYVKGAPVKAFRAPFKLTAPEAFHRIMWECGAGNLNSQGFGLLTTGKQEE